MHYHLTIIPHNYHVMMNMLGYMLIECLDRTMQQNSPTGFKTNKVCFWFFIFPLSFRIHFHDVKKFLFSSASANTLKKTKPYQTFWCHSKLHTFVIYSSLPWNISLTASRAITGITPHLYKTKQPVGMQNFTSHNNTYHPTIMMTTSQSIQWSPLENLPSSLRQLTRSV